MEVTRKRNQDTKVVFPLISSISATTYYTSNVWASLTNPTKNIYLWSDDTVAPISSTIAADPVQLGNTGEWYLVISASEISTSSQYMSIKLKADEILEQTILIRITNYDASVDTTCGIVTVSAYQNFPQVQVSGINNNVITSAVIAENSIGNFQLAPSAISNVTYAAGAITSTVIAANAIGATQIASNAIAATKIASNAITSAKIAAGSITNTQIATGAFIASHFAAGALQSSAFGTGALTSSTFAEGAFTSADFQQDYWNKHYSLEPQIVGVSAYNNFPQVQVSGLNVNTITSDVIAENTFTSADFGTEYWDKISQFQPTTVAVSAYYNFPNVIVSGYDNFPSVNVSSVTNGALVSADFGTEYWDKISQFQPTTVAVSAYYNFPSVNVSSVTNGALVSADFGTDYYQNISNITRNVNVSSVDAGVITTIKSGLALSTEVLNVQTTVNSISSNTNTIVSKLPLNQIADEQSVIAITNNTRFVASIPTEIVAPSSGLFYYEIKTYFYNSSGTMEDPDNNEIAIEASSVRTVSTLHNFYDNISGTVSATKSSTFSADGDFYKMVRVGLGVYQTYYKLDTSSLSDIDQYVIDFALKENGYSLHYGRTITVFLSTPGTLSLSDTENNKLIIAKAIRNYDASSIIIGNGSIEKTIEDTINSPKTVTVSAYNNFPQVTVSANNDKTGYTVTAGTINNLSNPVTVSAYNNFPSVNVSSINDGVITSADYAMDYYNRFSLIQSTVGVIVSAYQNFPQVRVSGVNGGLFIGTSAYQNFPQVRVSGVNGGLFIGTSAYQNFPQVTVSANNDKTGYIVTAGTINNLSNPVTVSAYQNFPQVTVSANNDKTGYIVTAGTINNLSNPVTVSAINDGAITSADFDIDYWTKIQLGLVTSDELSVVSASIISEINVNENKIDNIQIIVDAISANTNSISGLATTNQLSNVSATIISEINLNEIKIDSVQVTVNQISANTNSISGLATNNHLNEVSAVLKSELDINEGKIDDVQSLSNVIYIDTQYLINNPIDSNIVKVNGSNVVLSDFKNTDEEMYNMSLSAIDERFIFTSGYVETIISDETISAIGIVASQGVADSVLNTVIDIKTFREVLKILLSQASGKANRTNNTYIFYEQNNTTPLYSMNVDENGRSRN